MPEDPLLTWREEFPILAHTTYMISHSLSPMPRRAIAALAEYTHIWATRGIRAWEEGWWQMPMTCGNLIASIIGAAPNSVVMHQNVSVCQSIVTSCFDWADRERNKIVTDGLNFPSNDYLYHGLARQGARIVSTPVNPDLTLDLPSLLNSIDDQTRLVSVSHVAFRSSALLDLAAIVHKAHAVGALVIADLYQSAGIVPVNVTALNLDFATGGSVKWLLGGPGAGYLYVNPALADTLEPTATGWAAHAHPFDFAPGPIAYAPGIARFSTGTPNVPAMYSARSGYQIVNEIGVPAIRAKSIRQTEVLIALADAHALTVRSPRNPDHRGGVIILAVPEDRGRQLVADLAAQHILVDFRPGAGIRIAPHLYTTDEELHHTITTLAQLVRP